MWIAPFALQHQPLSDSDHASFFTMLRLSWIPLEIDPFPFFYWSVCLPHSVSTKKKEKILNHSSDNKRIDRYKLIEQKFHWMMYQNKSMNIVGFVLMKVNYTWIFVALLLTNHGFDDRSFLLLETRKIWLIHAPLCMICL